MIGMALLDFGGVVLPKEDAEDMEGEVLGEDWGERRCWTRSRCSNTSEEHCTGQNSKSS